MIGEITGLLKVVPNAEIYARKVPKSRIASRNFDTYRGKEK
jgi:hypothetical protein